MVNKLAEEIVEFLATKGLGATNLHVETRANIIPTGRHWDVCDALIAMSVDDIGILDAWLHEFDADFDITEFTAATLTQYGLTDVPEIPTGRSVIYVADSVRTQHFRNQLPTRSMAEGIHKGFVQPDARKSAVTVDLSTIDNTVRDIVTQLINNPKLPEYVYRIGITDNVLTIALAHDKLDEFTACITNHITGALV